MEVPQQITRRPSRKQRVKTLPVAMLSGWTLGVSHRSAPPPPGPVSDSIFQMGEGGLASLVGQTMYLQSEVGWECGLTQSSY